MRWVLAMSIGLMASAASAAEPVVTPFALEGDHIVIDATLNGKSGRFILDTGSGIAAIDGDFAEGLDLALGNRSVNAVGAGEGQASVRLGTAREVIVAGERLVGMPIGVMPKATMRSAGRNAAGTLGYDVFARWTIQIDYAAHQLTFFEPSDYRAPPGAIVLPADLGLRVPRIKVEIVPVVRKPAITANFVVDTGTSRFAFLLSPAFATKAGLDRVKPRIELGIGMGIAGPSIGDVLRLREARIGALTIDNVVIGVPREKTGFFASGLADGTIGQGVFRRGRLTADYMRSRFIFEPGESMNAPWTLAETCGWLPAKDESGAWSLAFVGQGTPAAKAGLAKGDKLLALDGASLSGHDRDAILDSCVQSGPLAVEFERDGQKRQTRVDRRSLI